MWISTSILWQWNVMRLWACLYGKGAISNDNIIIIIKCCLVCRLSLLTDMKHGDDLMIAGPCYLIVWLNDGVIWFVGWRVSWLTWSMVMSWWNATRRRCAGFTTSTHKITQVSKPSLCQSSSLSSCQHYHYHCSSSSSLPPPLIIKELSVAWGLLRLVQLCANGLPDYLGSSKNR